MKSTFTFSPVRHYYCLCFIHPLIAQDKKTVLQDSSSTALKGDARLSERYQPASKKTPLKKQLQQQRGQYAPGQIAFPAQSDLGIQ